MVRASVGMKLALGVVMPMWWCVQVTRFAAPLAYNYLHVIRMQEYLGSDRVCGPALHALGSHLVLPLCACNL